jgi:hypothetical protein
LRAVGGDTNNASSSSTADAEDTVMIDVS